MDLSEKLQNYIENIFSAPDFHIYHYTPNLEDILDSKCLRLSWHRNLNEKDNRELKIASLIIIKEMSSDLTLRFLVNRFNSYLSKGIQIYIASFCEEDNSQHALNNYGKKWICFKKEFIKKLLHSNNNLLLARVVYDLKEQKKIIRYMFRAYKKCINKGANKEKSLEQLFQYLTIILPLFKENRYSLDKECRFIDCEIMSPYSNGLVAKPCIKEIKFSDFDIEISR